jgi:hypothetical protein
MSRSCTGRLENRNKRDSPYNVITVLRTLLLPVYYRENSADHFACTRVLVLQYIILVFFSAIVLVLEYDPCTGVLG